MGQPPGKAGSQQVPGSLHNASCATLHCPAPQAACQSPAIFELLPPADFPYAKPPPQLTLWLKQPIPPPPEADSRPAAAAGVEQGAAVDAAHLPLCYATHQQYVVQPEAAAAAAAAAAPGDPAAPGLSSRATYHSVAAGSSTSNRTSAGSGRSGGGLQSAEQYVFGHAHLPGLMARLLKDNAGEGRHGGASWLWPPAAVCPYCGALVVPPACG